MKEYTLFDEAGHVIQAGLAQDHEVEATAAARPGSILIEGIQADWLRDKAVKIDGKFVVQRRTDEEIEARVAELQPPPVDHNEVMIEALKTLGFDLTTADLNAARVAVVQRNSAKRALGDPSAEPSRGGRGAI